MEMATSTVALASRRYLALPFAAAGPPPGPPPRGRTPKLLDGYLSFAAGRGQTLEARKRCILVSRRLPRAAITMVKASVQAPGLPTEKEQVDVLIIGSGPSGSAYARTLVLEGGRDVVMIDAGAQTAVRPGYHLKNAYIYQKDINLFASTVRGNLHTLSVPTDVRDNPTLDPGAYSPEYTGYVRSNQNPGQDTSRNLPAAGATYMVGGKGTHWTCSCPVPHPEVEMGGNRKLFPSPETYNHAKKILHVSQAVFKNECAIRGPLILDVLNQQLQPADYMSSAQYLPLAVTRINESTVKWTGADTVLGPLADVLWRPEYGRLQIREQNLCTKLVLSPDGGRVEYAEVFDAYKQRTVIFEADTFVVAGGTVLGAQLLFASGITPRALGKYLTEQPLAFCQVVLLDELVKRIGDEAMERGLLSPFQQWTYGNPPPDPVPIPDCDPDPQLWIPVSEQRPWHCQVHRDAFSYGELPPNVDPRLIVDFRWFGIAPQREENCVRFKEVKDVGYGDLFGLPQPTFEYTLTEDKETRHNLHKMMEDMVTLATAVGGILPGAEPQFLPFGQALHIHGHTRIGKDPETSVADKNHLVWGLKNLYIVGNGCIPSAIACNPTLTSVAMALQSARQLIKNDS